MDTANTRTADHVPSELLDRDASWKDFDTSTDAISFGFAATAILISMFLIMAIFEHLIRPRLFLSQQQSDQGSLQPVLRHVNQQHSPEKFRNPQVESPNRLNYSVLMPGQQCPTYLAQPCPLPGQREGIRWPSHDHHTLAFY
ncbi:hypothetical protein J5N97_020101 [Dioscorea zingiberensis]|uniref:Uncharacterized protein n=1 Tax=Dioscorea zingiberensis TaxID=325984 RepID=A0A9D5CF57_9LILI|nr:hypothetical protein J5N97_020101 [Dioscorea zingiberensis]